MNVCAKISKNKQKDWYRATKPFKTKENKNTKKCDFSDSAAAKRRQIGASSYFDRHQEEYQSYIFHPPPRAIF
jgi:hypothetical protein